MSVAGPSIDPRARRICDVFIICRMSHMHEMYQAHATLTKTVLYAVAVIYIYIYIRWHSRSVIDYDSSLIAHFDVRETYGDVICCYAQQYCVVMTRHGCVSEHVKIICHHCMQAEQWGNRPSWADRRMRNATTWKAYSVPVMMTYAVCACHSLK